MSKDPGKSAGYGSMYGQQVSGVNQGVDRIDSNISQLEAQIQRVPNKNLQWSSAFTGALGGMFGVGDMLRSNKQTDYYDQKFQQLG